MHHDDAVNAEQKNKPQIVLDYNDTKAGPAEPVGPGPTKNWAH